MAKYFASILCLFLVGCAANQQATQPTARTGTRARAAGPNLDAEHEWGSRMGMPGTHVTD